MYTNFALTLYQHRPERPATIAGLADPTTDNLTDMYLVHDAWFVVFRYRCYIASYDTYPNIMEAATSTFPPAASRSWIA
jgi:hypothetical protein